MYQHVVRTEPATDHKKEIVQGCHGQDGVDGLENTMQKKRWHHGKALACANQAHEANDEQLSSVLLLDLALGHKLVHQLWVVIGALYLAVSFMKKKAWYQLP